MRDPSRRVDRLVRLRDGDDVRGVQFTVAQWLDQALCDGCAAGTIAELGVNNRRAAVRRAAELDLLVRTRNL